jgi:hypothetical protein
MLFDIDTPRSISDLVELVILDLVDTCKIRIR